MGTFSDHFRTFLRHFRGPERTWKDIANKRGGGISEPQFWDRKMAKIEVFWCPKSSKIETKMSPKKVTKIYIKRNTLFKHFLMKMYDFPYLSSIERWRFRSRGSSILTLSKLYLISSVGTIAS